MLGLGSSLTSSSLVSSAEEVLRSAFAARVKADGGKVENNTCLLNALKDLL